MNTTIRTSRRVLVAMAVAAATVAFPACAQTGGQPGAAPYGMPTPDLTAPLAAPAAPAAPAPRFYADRLTVWAERLDARALELLAEPPTLATRIGPGATLKKGSMGDRVDRLVQRLIELAYMTEGQRSAFFDDFVDVAVRSFQSANGLRPDGLVGRATLDALERTPADTAVILQRTAASMRALRDERLNDIVVVNLPSQTVTLVRGGTPVLDMRAVVGRPSRETPLLRDRITHVIVNPTWTVPPTVLREDKLPLLRTKGSPGISNAVVYLDGEPVEPELVDWTVVTPGRVRIVQQPGDHNALGRFRFNLTNPYNIYLHGTNEPKLFAREVRTISSGCVRLEDARLMAETLLASQGIGTATIERLLERGEPQWVKLARPIPVRFTYWMATVGEAGDIRVHPDVYDLGDDQSAAPAPAPAPVPAMLTPVALPSPA